MPGKKSKFQKLPLRHSFCIFCMHIHFCLVQFFSPYSNFNSIYFSSTFYISISHSLVCFQSTDLDILDSLMFPVLTILVLLRIQSYICFSNGHQPILGSYFILFLYIRYLAYVNKITIPYHSELSLGVPKLILVRWRKQRFQKQ